MRVHILKTVAVLALAFACASAALERYEECFWGTEQSPAAAGADCETTAKGPYCGRGLICNNDNKCAAPPGAGQDCLQGTLNRYDRALATVLDNFRTDYSGIDGYDAFGNHRYINPNAGSWCAAGTTCNAGTNKCTAEAAAGEACDVDSDCKPGHMCQVDKCVAYGSVVAGGDAKASILCKPPNVRFVNGKCRDPTTIRCFRDADCYLNGTTVYSQNPGYICGKPAADGKRKCELGPNGRECVSAFEKIVKAAVDGRTYRNYGVNVDDAYKFEKGLDVDIACELRKCLFEGVGGAFTWLLHGQISATEFPGACLTASPSSMVTASMAAVAAAVVALLF